jgi:cysteine synthase A
MLFRVPESLVNIAHFQKINELGHCLLIERFCGYHAVPWSEGHRNSRRRARCRHDQQDHRASQGPWLIHDRQFENEANPDYHSRTTALEILDDFAGQRLDYWVTGYGTGGTLKGVARVLAKERPETMIIVCEPEDAQLLASGIPQSRNSDGTPAAPHPTFKPHPMQGWTPDFVPKLTDDAVAMKVHRSHSTDLRPRRHSLQQEPCYPGGIFVGITSGGTFAGKVAAEAEKGANILCMLPDTGERYLSTPLFADVSADMNEEELKISRSTPSAQLNL